MRKKEGAVRLSSINARSPAIEADLPAYAVAIAVVAAVAAILSKMLNKCIFNCATFRSDLRGSAQLS